MQLCSVKLGFNFMKRSFLIIAAAASISAGAAAQSAPGDMAVGLSAGVAPCIEHSGAPVNVGVTARFQYNLTSALRAELTGGYWFRDKGYDLAELGLNGQYHFNVSPRLSVYPTVGIGWASVKNPWYDISDYSDVIQDLYDRFGPELIESGNEELLEEILKTVYGVDEAASSRKSRFTASVGAGAEWRVSDHFALTLEARYQYMKDYQRIPVTLGAVYRF